MTPYLFFDGTCAEAMDFYAAVFGAEPADVMRFHEAPQGPGEGTGADPDRDAGRVMYAQLKVGTMILQGSDLAHGVSGPAAEARPASAFAVMHRVDDVASGEAVFDRLAEGGTVLTPYGRTFWAAGFGMVQDRFGVQWIVSTPGTPLDQVAPAA